MFDDQLSDDKKRAVDLVIDFVNTYNNIYNNVGVDVYEQYNDEYLDTRVHLVPVNFGYELTYFDTTNKYLKDVPHDIIRHDYGSFVLDLDNNTRFLYTSHFDTTNPTFTFSEKSATELLPEGTESICFIPSIDIIHKAIECYDIQKNRLYDWFSSDGNRREQNPFDEAVINKLKEKYNM